MKSLPRGIRNNNPGNFSISQTQPNFPTYSSMNASDTALLQAANNQKIT